MFEQHFKNFDDVQGAGVETVILNVEEEAALRPPDEIIAQIRVLDAEPERVLHSIEKLNST